ncbi:MAG TPA: threonine ammonia-lyase [Ilumatobacteraceae bacterium]|nr:threonine ammonia-lyase [Ilumatobacteraceae bacterium]
MGQLHVADVSADDVAAALDRIAAHVTRTPTSPSRTLSEITGAEVFVKFENLQFTASYKERGALNRLLLLGSDVAGVVTASAGNFAQGVSYHATRLGIPAVIVMPATTPAIKVSRTTVLGGEILLVGRTFDESTAIARDLAADRGLELLSPFDDPDVIAGQGTVAVEMLDDIDDVDVLIVPVGGGGLLAGMAVATRARQPAIELVGVQSRSYPGVYNAFTGAQLESGGATIADGIAVAEPGARPLRIIRELVDRVEVVDEASIEEAVGLYLEIEKSVAEGSGAIALAEVLARPERYRGRRVGLVLSGGNIDLRQLASVTMRSLVRTGRLTRLRIRLDDRPGSLGRLTTHIGELGGNIVDVVHQRLDPTVHARATEVELSVETSDRDHLHRLVAELRDAGHHVLTDDESRP